MVFSEPRPPPDLRLVARSRRDLGKLGRGGGRGDDGGDERLHLGRRVARGHDDAQGGGLRAQRRHRRRRPGRRVVEDRGLRVYVYFAVSFLTLETRGARSQRTLETRDQRTLETGGPRAARDGRLEYLYTATN